MYIKFCGHRLCFPLSNVVTENFFVGTAGVNDVYLKIGLGPVYLTEDRKLK
jgi:hypothetical protein